MRAEEISDPNDRLDFWAANTLIWGKPAPLLAYAQWLRDGDSDRWHDAAMNWNWDYGLAPIWWIANQDSCDAATALEIFYLNSPFYDGTPWAEEEQLRVYIRDRWNRNGFQTGRTRFDLPAFVQHYDGRNFDLVPQSMRCSILGEALATVSYEDGLPSHLFGIDPTQPVTSNGHWIEKSDPEMWNRVAEMLEKMRK